MFEIGDLVTTRFYPKESALVREVVKLDNDHCCQSGIMVTTVDKHGRVLRADAAWYQAYDPQAGIL